MICGAEESSDTEHCWWWPEFCLSNWSTTYIKTANEHNENEAIRKLISYRQIFIYFYFLIFSNFKDQQLLWDKTFKFTNRVSKKTNVTTNNKWKWTTVQFLLLKFRRNRDHLVEKKMISHCLKCWIRHPIDNKPIFRKLKSICRLSTLFADTM